MPHPRLFHGTFVLCALQRSKHMWRIREEWADWSSLDREASESHQLYRQTWAKQFNLALLLRKKRKNQPAQERVSIQQTVNTPSTCKCTQSFPSKFLNSFIASFLHQMLVPGSLSTVPHNKMFKIIYKEIGTTYIKKSQLEKVGSESVQFNNMPEAKFRCPKSWAWYDVIV